MARDSGSVSQTFDKKVGLEKVGPDLRARHLTSHLRSDPLRDIEETVSCLGVSSMKKTWLHILQ